MNEQAVNANIACISCARCLNLPTDSCIYGILISFAVLNAHNFVQRNCNPRFFPRVIRMTLNELYNVYTVHNAFRMQFAIALKYCGHISAFINHVHQPCTKKNTSNISLSTNEICVLHAFNSDFSLKKPANKKMHFR